MLWVEKYCFKILDDFVGNDDVVDCMWIMVWSGFMLNLIFFGFLGCGKMFVIGVLVWELLGDKYKEVVLEMNVSDEWGIDVVRNKIKMFA